MSIARCIVAGILLAFGVAGVARAQAPLWNRMFRSELIQCRIVDGRVRLETTRLGNIQSTSRAASGRKESIDLRNENGQASLSYKMSCAKEELSVAIAAANESVDIVYVKLKESPPSRLEFHQAAGEDILLIVGEGDDRRELRAINVWQMLIVHSEDCKSHLLPLVKTLQPDWNLPEAAAAVEARLVQDATEGKPSNASRWSELVAQLGDDDFARREAADRALRAGGVACIAYLRQLDFDRLDAEQQFRVERILQIAAEENESDTPELAAASLANNLEVWLALLSRPDRATRETAARKLAELLGEPIAVDPAAEPDAQKDQRESLRQRIEHPSGQ